MSDDDCKKKVVCALQRTFANISWLRWLIPKKRICQTSCCSGSSPSSTASSCSYSSSSSSCSYEPSPSPTPVYSCCPSSSCSTVTSSPSPSITPSVSVSVTPSISPSASPYVSTVSLSDHLTKQIDDLLDESMSIEVNGKVFISQDHATRGYMRNEDLWCADLDLTGLSPWNSSGGHKKAGTLITPRHVIGAAHYEYSVGTVVRFVEKDAGVVHDRTVVGKVRHPKCKNYNPDLTIYTLDSDLPSTIKPYSVLPSDYSKYFDNIYKSKIPCIGFDQEEKALIIDWANGGRMRTPTDSKRLIFNESKIKGDSGNPAFLIFQGEPVLVTVWTFGGAGAGTPIANYISDINGMIATADKQAGVNTNYTVTEADLSLVGSPLVVTPSPTPMSSSSATCWTPSSTSCTCCTPSSTPYSCCPSSSCSTVTCCSSPSPTPYSCCPSSSCSIVTCCSSSSPTPNSSCVPFTKDKVWVNTPKMPHPWPKFKYLEGDIPGNLTKTLALTLTLSLS